MKSGGIKMEIKLGSVYKDCWGRKWQVIGFDKESNKWQMLLWINNYVSDFSTEELKNKLTLFSH